MVIPPSLLRRFHVKASLRNVDESSSCEALWPRLRSSADRFGLELVEVDGVSFGGEQITLTANKPTEGRPQVAAPTWIGLPGEPLGVTLGNHRGLPLPASAQNAVYFTTSAASRAPADEFSTWNLQRSTFEERRS